MTDAAIWPPPRRWNLLALLLGLLLLAAAAAPSLGAPSRPWPAIEVGHAGRDLVRVQARYVLPDYRPRWEVYLIDSHGLLDHDRGLVGHLRTVPGARMVVVMWSQRDGRLRQTRQLFVHRGSSVELLDEREID